MQILLVDDEHEGRTYLARYITLLGHQVTQCPSAEEALALVARGGYDLVISDVMMEGMTGTELAEALGTRPGRQPDVILYSGCLGDQMPGGGRRARTFAYLPKPIDVRRLQQLLQQVEQRRG